MESFSFEHRKWRKSEDNFFSPTLSSPERMVCGLRAQRWFWGWEHSGGGLRAQRWFWGWEHTAGVLGLRAHSGGSGVESTLRWFWGLRAHSGGSGVESTRQWFWSDSHGAAWIGDEHCTRKRNGIHKTTVGKHHGWYGFGPLAPRRGGNATPS